MNPQYAKVDNKLYKINTSYKVALKCNEVMQDETTSDYEKMLAVIYLLFGDEGLKDKNNYNKLMELAFKYLLCGEEMESSKEKPDMDFKQDFKLIKASFMSDFGIDISKQDLEWYDFYTYLNGLKEDCILNRVRSLRTYDEKKIADKDDRQNLIKAKRRFALKKNEPTLTKEQEESMNRLNELIGI